MLEEGSFGRDEALNIVLTYFEVADDKFLGSSLIVVCSFLVNVEFREVLAVDVRAQDGGDHFCCGQ